MLPKLPLSWTRLAIATAVSTAGCKLCGYGLALAVGSPVPSGMMIESSIWCVLLFGFLYPVISPFVCENPTRRAQLREWLDVSALSASLLFSYPFYNYLFANVASKSPVAQPALALLLAVVKIAFKNAFNRIVREQPDLKAQIVNLHVEIFNALFVTFSMQSATSFATLAVLMLVDFLHACSAFYEVHRAVQALQVLERGLHLHQSAGTIIDRANAILAQQPTHSCLQSAVCRRQSTIAHSSNGTGPNQSYLQLLQKFTSRRKVSVLPPKQVWTATVEPRGRQILPWVSVVPLIAASGGSTSELDTEKHARVRSNGISGPSTTEGDAYAAKVLELLYLTEFTVLNEYIEVIVPAVYAAYMVAMVHLPNRVYFPHLAALSGPDLNAMLAKLLVYVLLELGSLFVLDWTLRRRLRFSPTSQLAFVLETRWQSVQAELIPWVVYVVQTSLYYYGFDYSFQFAWLAKQGTPRVYGR